MGCVLNARGVGRASFKPHLRLKMKGWAVEGGELVWAGRVVRVDG